MEKYILRFILWMIGNIGGKNADLGKVRIIAETKVLMDKRRSIATYRSGTKKTKNPMTGALIMYALTGLFFGLMIGLLDNIMYVMILAHAYLMFMMCMTLVTDFSSVLFDNADSQIILPKPVNARTYFLARLAHILTYLLQYLIALFIIPIIATFIKFGIVAGAMNILMAVMNVVFSVFLTYFIYGLLMRFSTEEKIKRYVTNLQVFMTLFVALSYQILPRMINMAENMHFNLKWYSYFMPPVWFAKSIETATYAKFDAIGLLMIVISFIMPLLAMFIMLKYLAPAFSQRMMTTSNTAENKQIGTKQHASKTLADAIANALPLNSAGKSIFGLTWKMMSRDRTFKMSFYPAFAYTFILIIVIFVRRFSIEELKSAWENLSHDNKFIVLLYISISVLGTGLAAIKVSDKSDATWIYQASPIEKPGQLLLGSTLALMIKYILPVQILLSALAIYIKGYEVIDDCIFALLNTFLLGLIYTYASTKYLPFSVQPNMLQQGGKFGRMLLQLLITSAIIGLHYWLIYIKFPVWTLLIVPAGLIVLMLGKVKNIDWNQIAFIDVSK